MEEHKHQDPEKGFGNDSGRTDSPNADISYIQDSKTPWSTRFVDSFRRDPNAAVTKPSQREEVDGFDHRAAAEATANSGLARELKPRHLQMIAIGGSIGLFSSNNMTT